jgi:hypothetical protein
VLLHEVQQRLIYVHLERLLQDAAVGEDPEEVTLKKASKKEKEQRKDEL